MLEKNDLRTSVPFLIRGKDQSASVSQCQCDCACETPLSSVKSGRLDQDQLGLADAIVSDTRYIRSPIYSVNPITIGFSRFFAILGPDGVSTANSSALEVIDYFQQYNSFQEASSHWEKKWGKDQAQKILNELIESKIIVPEGHAESELTRKSEVLSAWLHITDRCNLRCAYCYLPHKKEDMSLETGKKAIDAIFRSAVKHNYREIKLKYAGGEPLLNFEKVRVLHDYALDLARPGLFSKEGISLRGIILSNGTRLTPDMVHAMRSSGLNLMISLDSIKSKQGNPRTYADGRDSSADVVESIETALDHGLVPDISVTVSGRNANELPEIVTWLMERDISFSLNFYRENDYSAKQDDLQLEEEKIIESMRAAYKIIEENLPDRALLNCLIDRVSISAPHETACAAGESYLVFDPQGNVRKCQMQDPVSDSISASIKDDDPLGKIRADTQGIQNFSVDEKSECASCEWKYWCAGGCPLTAYRTTGSYQKKSPNCHIYQELLPDAVRLEGLRLLEHCDQTQ
ncbi:MAG: hypothetical protein B6244_09670 [Candidatus Cloacimonetes bacterium 4572_55]|nr:MAG: hypothetical protein B6244_09670 [Candidatus Cloacimonetes bacterium 4572_55]